MKYALRLSDALLQEVHDDLSRPHPHAFERVGHLHCRVGIDEDFTVILAERYFPVADADYLPSQTVGAMIGPAAIRGALQRAFQRRDAVFHIHRHDHMGPPAFSSVDVRENARCVPDFWKVSPDMPHGAVVLSFDAAFAQVWCPHTRMNMPLRDIRCIGAPTRRLGDDRG